MNGAKLKRSALVNALKSLVGPVGSAGLKRGLPVRTGALTVSVGKPLSVTRPLRIALEHPPIGSVQLVCPGLGNCDPARSRVRTASCFT